MEQIAESLSVVFISPFRDRLSFLLWCIFAAALLAFVYLLIRKNTLGKAISGLLKASCTHEESAKSAEELGWSPRVVAFLQKGKDRLIRQTETDGKTRYYLPEENRKKGEYFLKAASFPVRDTVLAVLCLYAALVALYYILPAGFPAYFGNL